MLRVVFRTTANKQALHAQYWYEKQRKGLGAEFARSLESAVSRVGRNPFAAHVVYSDTSATTLPQEIHRVLLKRFPYAVFYLAENDTLLVLACMHTRQLPPEPFELS